MYGYYRWFLIILLLSPPTSYAVPASLDEHEQREFQDEELQIEDGDADVDKEAEATARLLHFPTDEEMDCSSDSDSDCDSVRDSDSDVISDWHAVWLEFIPD